MDNLTDQRSKVLGILKGEATLYGLDPQLLIAIATIESSLNPFKCRHEPNWAYPLRVKEFALLLNQSEDTELVQQSTSWGALQIMGSVARERGFRDYLALLSVPAVGIRYGVLHLKHFVDSYPELTDAIASYNAGSPRRKDDGTYVNQDYVDKVLKKMGE